MHWSDIFMLLLFSFTASATLMNRVSYKYITEVAHTKGLISGIWITTAVYILGNIVAWISYKIGWFS